MLVTALLLICSGVVPDGFHPFVAVGPFMGQNLCAKGTCHAFGPFYSSIGSGSNSKEACGAPDYELVHPPVSGVRSLTCIAELLKLGWDSTTKTSITPSHVDIRVMEGIGGQDLGAGHVDLKIGWGQWIVPHLVELGYEVDKDIIGHNYDWRLGLIDWQNKDFPKLKGQIEKTVKENGMRPAVVTSMSMGGPYFHNFLQWVDKLEEGWKHKYVHAFVPMGAPFNGAHSSFQSGLSTAIGSYEVKGSCPSCNPVRRVDDYKTDESTMEYLTRYAKEAADYVLQDYLRESLMEWPSVQYLSPGIDHTLPKDHPGHDPVVLISEGSERHCVGEASLQCGATVTSRGSGVKAGFLNANTCGECSWHVTNVLDAEENSLRCPDGTELASLHEGEHLCCKRHRCTTQVYKASQIPFLLNWFGYHDAADMYKTAKEQPTTSDPGIDVHCIIGYNVMTPGQMTISTSKDLKSGISTPETEMVNGDGTVHMDSLEVCARWSRSKVYKLNGVLHVNPQNVKATVDLLTAILKGDGGKAELDSWVEPPWLSPPLDKRDGTTSCEPAAKLFDVEDQPLQSDVGRSLGLAEMSKDAHNVRESVTVTAGGIVREDAQDVRQSVTVTAGGIVREDVLNLAETI